MHSLIEAYGFLCSCELEVKTSHSKIPEIQQALHDAENSICEAQIHLKRVLTFKEVIEKVK